MKKKLLLLVSGAIIVIAIAGSLLLPLTRERRHIRERIDAIRRALRNNDVAGVAAFVTPRLRVDYQNQEGLEHYRVHIGTDNAVPSIWISGDKATVTPTASIISDFSLAATLEMAKESGEWFLLASSSSTNAAEGVTH